MIINRFLNLSGPLRILALAGGGASFTTIVFAVASGNRTLLIILGIALVALAAALGLYMLFVKIGKKKKAKQMDNMLGQHNAGSSGSITSAESRVRLDDMRKRFSEGVVKFKNAGKDIYSLPWYVVVGEPGSGKTEAVRHSNVGFPPGLQDEMQGVGGTINMNWWFTNYGVILDTAGKLLFEEVQPGKNNEWTEFLKLLKKSRPSCPINGLVLVIPIDSLIKDTAEEIESKAKKIAVQMDEIQNLLNIRFPVFILVSKSDLITGFREFFQNIEDPELQHQILGWSNTDDLDTPFQPQEVESYLSTLIKSLENRRLGLLRSPFSNGEERWANEADSLYYFPEAMARIYPRLRRYMELIFVAGEWSQKPLFLRGIYFTSSLQEGSALDEELSKAMGIEVGDLPGQGVFEREKAYFLRDVILKKVFVEKGLVTSVSDTKKMVRGRKFALLSCGFVGLIGLLGIAWYGSYALKERIGKQQDYWDLAASSRLWVENKWRLPIVSDESIGDYWTDNQQSALPVSGENVALTDFIVTLDELATEEINTPIVFRPLEALVDAFSDRELDRRKPLKVIFESAVLWPLTEGLRERVLASSGDWTNDDRVALDSLIKLEQAVLQGGEARSLLASGNSSVLNNMMRYLTGSNLDPRLEAIYLKLYANEENDGYELPIWLSEGSTLESNEAIRLSVNKFIGYVQSAQEKQSVNLDRLKTLSTFFKELDDEENEFLSEASSKISVASLSEYNSSLSDFKNEVDSRVSTSTDEGIFRTDSKISLVDAYRREVATARDNIGATVSGIQSILKIESEGEDVDESSQIFSEINALIESEKGRIDAAIESSMSPEEVAELERLDAALMNDQVGEPLRIVSRIDAYLGSIEQASVKDPSPVFGDLKINIQSLLGGINDGKAKIDNYSGFKDSELKSVCRNLLDTAFVARRDSLLGSYAAIYNDYLRKNMKFPVVFKNPEDFLSDKEVFSAKRTWGMISQDLQGLAGLELGASSSDWLKNANELDQRLILTFDSLDVSNQRVRVVLPGQQEQNRLLNKYVDDFDGSQLMEYVWTGIQLNEEAVLRTREGDGGKLGEVEMLGDPFAVKLHKTDKVNNTPADLQGQWATLKLLHDFKAIPKIGNKEWDIVLRAESSGREYYIIVSLIFEKPLVDLEDWSQ